MVDRKTLEENRMYVARTFNIPASGIIMQRDGWFEIYRVPEHEKMYIAMRANSDKRISQMMYHGQLDFNHPKPMALVSKVYTIRGQID
jgi:hypothetical protein